MCSLFFLFLSFIFEKVFSFSHFVSKNQGAKKKKKKGNKKEKRNGEWGLRVWWEKRESGKEKRKKKLKGKKLNWFYLYVYFVWCKV
jgi:hypothetical protein